MNKKYILTFMFSLLVITIIATAITKNAPKNNLEQNDIIQSTKEEKMDNLSLLVRVNGKLYQKTEEKIPHICGIRDGNISSHVASSKTPQNDDEANFDGDIGYQIYGEDKLIVWINNEKCFVFKKID